MGQMLPWWLLISPAVLIVLDSIMSSKTSAMTSGQTGSVAGRPVGAH